MERGSRVTGRLAFAILAAVLGMLRFGYHTGVINAPQADIERFINSSLTNQDGTSASKTAETLFSVAVSLFAVGGMAGSVGGGWLADRIGRKGALGISAFAGVVSSILMGFCSKANSYSMLAIGRVITGLDSGLATAVAPVFVSEVAPIELRGAAGTLNQLAVTTGLLLSQILGIEEILGNATGWPLLLGLGIIPAVIQAFLLYYCPESPRYLLAAKGDEAGARRTLVALRGVDEVDADVDEIVAEARSRRAEESIPFLDLFKNPALRAPLIVGIVTHLSQQLSGINGVFYYSTKLFAAAGLSVSAAKQATIGVGATMFASTLVAVPLMDSAGRRTLHLCGLGGMFVCTLLMTAALYTYRTVSIMSGFSVAFTLAYCASFGIGPGSIPWMIMSEMFSHGARSSAVALGALVNWLANFVIGLVFPSLIDALGDALFLPFSVLVALFWIFAYFKMPETKNKTIEEITAMFSR